MQNRLFRIEPEKDTGCLRSIVLATDPDEMNYCAEDGQWGKIHAEDIRLVSVQENGDTSVCVWESPKLTVTVTRGFAENGRFFERYTVANRTETVITVTPDNFGVEVPFNDRYTCADECMIHHCDTHIWCGHHVTWVNALKMGPSEQNLGLYLTEGAIDCYSQNGCKSNNRGIFVFHAEPFMLKKGESYRFSWELFPHSGTEEFFRILQSYPTYIGIGAEHFTVFEDEPLRLSVRAANGGCPTLTCDEESLPVDFDAASGTGSAEFHLPMGEHRVMVSCGSVRTWADVIVKLPLDTLLENRVHFIVRHQQCRDPESPLYGAFLIYDNETETTYFDFSNPDHNACRERMNLALLVLKYLQTKEDPEVYASIGIFSDFLYREIYDDETGEVFNTIGKYRDQLRLYNAPGVMLVFAELYRVTKNTMYLRSILKLAKQYYGVGGKKCYANGIAIDKVIRVFEEGGWQEERRIMLDYFRQHVEHIIGNGLSYPAHEVNYEQTIVTPAVNHISEYGLYAEDKAYFRREAARHLECLVRFNGMQPSAHLNEIALRYWDGFWFGKRKTFGDTLPHHLSCLTARAFIAYYRISGETVWLKKAEECLRNCMSLVLDNARGSAAYLYPYTLNGVRGQFYDPWSNDQDLVLYDALYYAAFMDTVPEKNEIMGADSRFAFVRTLKA